MGEEELPKIILFSDIKGTRKKGKPKITWKDNIKDDLKKFNIKTENWMKLAKGNKKDWKEAVQEGIEYFENNWREERNNTTTKAYLMELPEYQYHKINQSEEIVIN